MSEYVIMPKADYVAACDAIRAKTGKTDLIKSGDMEPEILGITTGGGSSADVRYVTFMNDDGTVQLGKKAVAVGDDCADPIARGIFGTPTKESTAQYSYTFSGGWATTPGGGKDSNALKAVTEDRTVYANFISAVRYYTITFYDSDGTTVLKTSSLAYGATPSYNPIKDGYLFTGWVPALTTVTGNASYTASWEESLTFAASSWATIAAKSADGTASQAWKVGDKKTIPYNGGELSLVIAGFNHDDLADGTGKAGISIVFDSLPSDLYYWDNKKTVGGYLKRAYVANEYIQTNLNSILNSFPEELRAVIKPVTKQCCDTATSGKGTTTTDQSLWMLSLTEMGVPMTGTSETVLGSRYAYFPSISTSATKFEKGVCGNQTTYYWTRSANRPSVFQPYVVMTNGSWANLDGYAPTGDPSKGRQYQYRLGFCV